jgi:hypothetical protein
VGRDSLHRHVRTQQLLEAAAPPTLPTAQTHGAPTLPGRISHAPAVGSNGAEWEGAEEERGDRTLRSGEISADLRSARRSAISASASASPAPLESRGACRSGRIGGRSGGLGEGKREREEGVGERRGEERAAAWASSWPEWEERSEACTRRHARPASGVWHGPNDGWLVSVWSRLMG